MGDPLLDQREAGVLENAGDLDTILHHHYFCHVQSNQEENQHHYSKVCMYMYMFLCVCVHVLYTYVLYVLARCGGSCIWIPKN